MTYLRRPSTPASAPPEPEHVVLRARRRAIRDMLRRRHDRILDFRADCIRLESEMHAIELRLAELAPPRRKDVST